MDAGLRAVMFTDIVGSTEMTARLGDAAAVELVRVHHALVRCGLAAHRGPEVKHTGDGIMAAFDEVPNAVRAPPIFSGTFLRITAARSRG
jgi:class 3 adenylate cyclase